MDDKSKVKKEINAPLGAPPRKGGLKFAPKIPVKKAAKVVPKKYQVRLDVEPARLGSAQLELARYGNELARLGSLSGRAESQARLGSFGISSWLVWLTSQLKKKPSQLALVEPDASMAAGWWRNKKMSRVFLHGCGERGPAAGGPRRRVVGGAGQAAGDDRTGEVAGQGRGRRRARRRGRSPQGGRRPPAARRAARRGAGHEAAGQGAGPQKRVVGGAGRAAGDDRTGEVTGRGRGEATGLASRPAAAQRWEWETFIESKLGCWAG
ncbi:hypothetical protein PVAP13_7NG145017 [Panicum virgatum]|uniref:Uncharacterized protein n=1 Tax=Panicum virgatum TaxID=38727 RepID=A0A8T0PY77_PANVG|nr:hypothetical protein PVAP13_7NG145017 [Panicum virgatum]